MSPHRTVAVRSLSTPVPRPAVVRSLAQRSASSMGCHSHRHRGVSPSKCQSWGVWYCSSERLPCTVAACQQQRYVHHDMKTTTHRCEHSQSSRFSEERASGNEQIEDNDEAVPRTTTSFPAKFMLMPQRRFPCTGNTSALSGPRLMRRLERCSKNLCVITL
ncbi:hypothetical protein CONPUDRAFT_82859 [Coniophora puteana RWD-64-598 SS2]|uniref:Uncharacterized protein n=1 Tax=Coniophora puteana (strain RWD-64-598) TaxID=741705 RepID=A0A5M3MNU6_CONPW|nr:uncharacterized protein CONPUDRAFT_82859 [Coniophora puteana RWD-64-598 SS2]EIW80832.1 hypothetical protein CONPUDRAFT_82859 [Coniophora puteana RWD-64-598 SS2]